MVFVSSERQLAESSSQKDLDHRNPTALDADSKAIHAWPPLAYLTCSFHSGICGPLRGNRSDDCIRIHTLGECTQWLYYYIPSHEVNALRMGSGRSGGVMVCEGTDCEKDDK